MLWFEQMRSLLNRNDVRRLVIWVLIVMSILVSVPYLVPSFRLVLAAEILIFCIYALSFNLLLGYTGLVSYGHAGFLAIGGYSAAIAFTKFDQGIYLSIAWGVMGALIVSVVVGLILVRVSSFYFSMLSLAMGQLVYLVANKWYSVTGGDNGVHGMVREGWLATAAGFYYFVLAFGIAVTLLMLRYIGSPVGYSLRALRENRKRLNFIGVNPLAVQYLSIVVSGMVAGLAGALYVFLGSSVDPGIAHVNKSFEPLLSSILGGIHSFWGPIVGTIFFKLIEAVFVSVVPTLWPLFMGTILILFTVGWPYGVIGFIQDPRFHIWMWKPTLRSLRYYHDSWYLLNIRREKYWKIKD